MVSARRGEVVKVMAGIGKEVLLRRNDVPEGGIRRLALAASSRTRDLCQGAQFLGCHRERLALREGVYHEMPGLRLVPYPASVWMMMSQPLQVPGTEMSVRV